MAFPDLFLPLKAVFTNLSRARKIIFIILASLIPAVFISLFLWTGSPNLKPLYSNLSPEDAGIVIEKLKAEKIPYRAVSGNTILVPEDQLFEITMTMAAQGLPRGGGAGFEIFDKTKMGMSEFEQNIHYQRALQGELARTINTFSEVRNCRVHIVMASESLFVEDEKPASASVILNLVPGAKLSRRQIQGIVHLLSAGISGLSPDNIAIVDNRGNMLSDISGGDAAERINSEHFEIQKRIARDYERHIKTMLEDVLGQGKAIVRVSCDLNIRKHEMTEEKYEPDKVLRSERISNISSGDSPPAAAGVPGVLSNMNPDAGAEEIQTGKGIFLKKEQTSNYEISKIIRHVTEPVGEIRKLSVAVVVDGSYKRAAAENRQKEDKAAGEETAKAEESLETVYVPRTKEELDILTKIVKNAVNFDAQRGDSVEVVNLSFAAEKTAVKKQEDTGWLTVLKAFTPYIPALLFFLFILLVAMPLVRWLTRSSAALNPRMMRQLPMTVRELESEYGDSRQIGFNGRLNRAVNENREETARLLRKWIKEQ
ncbi:MAG: flagellar basal-body MS-ring/collar protein FliF [Desulfococcaceae bacterium]|nr:flagellar basal-body MS-ring/collar protein FliF [Desulfococcaceae bacterium]